MYKYSDKLRICYLICRISVFYIFVIMEYYTQHKYESDFQYAKPVDKQGN